MTEMRMQNAKCKMQKEGGAKGMDLRRRTFVFACRVVRTHRALVRRDFTLRPLLYQFLRSGTSIGANIEEAEGAHSKPDFISKCRNALKEARETLYWLRVFVECDIAPSSRLQPLTNEARELVAIITTIVRKASSSPSR